MTVKEPSYNFIVIYYRVSKRRRFVERCTSFIIVHVNFVIVEKLLTGKTYRYRTESKSGLASSVKFMILPSRRLSYSCTNLVCGRIGRVQSSFSAFHPTDAVGRLRLKL